MLIFVYGNDTFRVAQKVATMKAAFHQKFDQTGFNTVEFSNSSRLESEVGQVMNAVCSLPFFGKKRMVIIRGLVELTKKEEAKVWAERFKSAPESSIVVFWETMESVAFENKPLFVFLKDAARVHNYSFPLLAGVQLNRWVAQRVKERNGKIDERALHELVLRVGSDLWRMDGEIEKLVAYASGETVTFEMVQRLVNENFEEKIFALMDAISQHKKSEAVRLLRNERLAGSDDHYLLTMLGRQVRILLGARAMLNENPCATKQELASVMALNPYVAQKALAQAGSFTVEELKCLHDLLFGFDEQIKVGRIEAALAVDLIVAKMIE